ncbi:MAG: hypothetical protein INR71_02900 [Terriglobus roseus]|nr:hypothetical protein [Terriglobus roseus]
MARAKARIPELATRILASRRQGSLSSSPFRLADAFAELANDGIELPKADRDKVKMKIRERVRRAEKLATGGADSSDGQNSNHPLENSVLDLLNQWTRPPGAAIPAAGAFAPAAGEGSQGAIGDATSHAAPSAAIPATGAHAPAAGEGSQGDAGDATSHASSGGNKLRGVRSR